MEVVWFVVLVGALVLVHELGHFASAKFFGVRVLKFSIGFGPKLFGFSRNGTEYQLAAIPLGGFVRMLGEGPHDVVAEEEEDDAFFAQPLWRRLLIVAAGPAMNLFLPLVLFFFVHLGTAESPPPVIGMVFAGRPAAGKLAPGDRVVAIDGDEVATFDELQRIVGDASGKSLRFDVERDGARVQFHMTPERVAVARDLDRVEQVGRIGVSPAFPLAVIGVPTPGPAAAAHMTTFDRIVSAGGERVDRLFDLERVLDRNRGTMLPVTFLRPSPVEHALGGLLHMDLYEPRIATITPEAGSGEGLRRAGIEPADLYVSRVTAGSREHLAGLLPGDRLVALDGEAVAQFAEFSEKIRETGERPHRVTWTRAGKRMEATYALEHVRGLSEYGERVDRYAFGIRNWVPVETDPFVPHPHALRYAIRTAFARTGEMIEITATMILRLFEGRVSVRSIGGPMLMFEIAGQAARSGPVDYATLMAFVSVNLGLINLMPIPLLDGGHLLFFLIEGVTRRPIGKRAREIASLVGFAVLMVLVVLAFKNDIERRWGDPSGYVESR